MSQTLPAPILRRTTSPTAPRALRDSARAPPHRPDVIEETTVEVDVELGAADDAVSFVYTVDVVVYGTVEDEKVDRVDDDEVEIAVSKRALGP
jgi:hypothetical protein